MLQHLALRLRRVKLQAQSVPGVPGVTTCEGWGRQSTPGQHLPPAQLRNAPPASFPAGLTAAAAAPPAPFAAAVAASRGWPRPSQGALRMPLHACPQAGPFAGVTASHPRPSPWPLPRHGQGASNLAPSTGCSRARARPCQRSCLQQWWPGEACFNGVIFHGMPLCQWRLFSAWSGRPRG